MKKKHFLALHPLIGTKNKPAAISEQERSPYYWWWAYLKRNQQYLTCCQNEGNGELLSLYKNFGDIRSDDFPDWWGRKNRKGEYLFSETISEVLVNKLNSKDEWEDEWTDTNVIVMAVNLDIGRRKLQRMFANVLNKNHKGKRGRQALGKAVSTSKYPLHRNFSRHNLKTMLLVYDAWYANSLLPKKERLSLWKIGEQVRIIPHQITTKTDEHHTRVTKQKIMTVTVSRYVKNAKAIIANTIKGQFPNSSVD